MNLLIASQETGMAELRGDYKAKWLVGGPKVKIQNVRNISCRAALNGGATHLGFVDDDMLLSPPDIFARLLRHDKDIISPLFFRSGGNHEPLIFNLNGDGEPHPILDYERNALFEVSGGVGTGVMLIKRKVLEAIGEPWFFYPNDSHRGMDIHFCLRAIKLGFKVWCDTSIVVKQMGMASPVGEADFLRFKSAGLTAT